MPGIGIGISRFLYSNRGASDTFLRAIGGEISFVGGDKLHYFPASNDFTILNLGPNLVRTFKQAGGGSGGNGAGTSAGGGAGGQNEDITESFSAVGTFPFAIGLGGVPVSFVGANGGNTSFNGKTVLGGRYGGGYTTSSNGASGYNGGGGGSYSDPAGARGLGGVGTNFSGGDATAYASGNAGGGGAGQGGAGQNAVTTTGGNGGPGTSSDISGSTVYYGGGGGGSADAGGLAGDGQHGGGDGGLRDSRPAAAGTRGGGGGGYITAGSRLGGDGLGYVRYPHPGIDATTSTIFASSTDYSRWDGTCIIELSNGTFLMGIQVFGAGSGDFNAANIRVYSSTDLENWSFVSNILKDVSWDGALCPCFYQKDNGDIICVYFEHNGSEGRILQIVSTDSGATWNAPTVIKYDSGVYLNMYPREIFVTPTGRLLIPFEVAGGDLLTGTYTGRTLYSDDEGDNWTLATDTIDSPPTQSLESGMIQVGATIRRYYRSHVTASGSWFVDSVDDGETWSSPVLTDLPSINSAVSIEKLSNGHYCAFYNKTDRTTAQIAYSLDGEVFTNNWTMATTGVGEQLIEATIKLRGNYLYIFYSSSTETGNKFSLVLTKIKLNTYA